MLAFVAGGLLIILGIVLLFVRKKDQGKLLEIRDVKTSTARDLAEMSRQIKEEIGAAGFKELAEVKGILRCDRPLVAELSGQNCVFYDMRVEERFEERYEEEDSQGKKVHKTRTGNTVVASNRQTVDFEIEDSSGRVMVNPNGAEIDSVEVVDRFVPGTSGGPQISFGSFKATVPVSSSGRKILGYRYVERVLPLERRVYVLGEVSDVSGRLVIGKPGESGKPFLVSLKSEEELVRSAKSRIKALLVGALVCFVAGTAAFVFGVLD